MTMQTDCASTRIKCSPDVAFGFLSNPTNMDLWSFGTWKTCIDDDGLIKGQALQDGSSVFVRIVPHAEQLLIDYYVGTDSARLQPRIFIRIISGEAANLNRNECVVMMVAVRTPDMSDERWQSMVNVHSVEVELIRSLIETGHDHRR